MRTDCPDCVWTIQGRTIKSYRPCDVCKRDTLIDHKLRVDRQTGKWHWPETRNYCHRCGKDMRARAVHPRTDWPNNPGAFDPAEELQNECNLIFAGGYGSFIDDLGEMPVVTICHECGHELCDSLGIDPRNWHTHSIYGGQHHNHHDNQEAFRR